MIWQRLTGLQWAALAVLVLVVCIVAWQWYTYDPPPGTWGVMRLK